MANVTITNYSWTVRVMELEGGARLPVTVLDIYPDVELAAGDQLTFPSLNAPPATISALLRYGASSAALRNLWSGILPETNWQVGVLKGSPTSSPYELWYFRRLVSAGSYEFMPAIRLSGYAIPIFSGNTSSYPQSTTLVFMIRDANSGRFITQLLTIGSGAGFYENSLSNTVNELGVVYKDNVLLGIVISDLTAAPADMTVSFANEQLQAVLSQMTRPITDPYGPGGSTEPSGPNTGTWTIVNDDIDFPALPTITASDTGFFSIWVPTLEQIQLLAGFMWNTDVLNIDFWKRMVTSPLELILGLSLFPFNLDVDGHEPLTLGLVDTRIDTNYRNSQFFEVNCGTVDLEEYYGAFLDYAPFTQLDIYLPYIGVRTVNINDVMPKRLELRYRIDLVSGSCVAMLKADGSIFYHWTGSCSVQIPVTTQQMQSLVSGAISAVGAVAGGILTGGIAGALAATTGVASAAANSSQHVGRSGTLGSAAGFLAVQAPYLILTRPRQAVPEDQNHYTGYPTFITAKLGDLTGYTEVEMVHLHDIPATSDELDEIERLLREGVIL